MNETQNTKNQTLKYYDAQDKLLGVHCTDSSQYHIVQEIAYKAFLNNEKISYATTASHNDIARIERPAEFQIKEQNQSIKRR